MSETLKSVKIPLSAWRALTRICSVTEEPRTKVLARLIVEAEKAILLTEEELQLLAKSQQKGSE